MTRELHIVTGAAGVGKSTFGKQLAAERRAALLDSDTLSEAVVQAGMRAAGLDPTDRDSAAYKALFRDAVYQCLFATAQENLPHTDVVIVGPFTRELNNAAWPQQLFDRFGVLPTVWFLGCNNETRHQRIKDRGNPRDQIKLDAWPEHLVGDETPAFKAKLIRTDT